MRYEVYIDVARVTLDHAIDADDCPDFHRAPLRIARDQLESLYGAAVSNRANARDQSWVYVRTPGGANVEARAEPSGRTPFLPLPPLTRRECEAAYAAFDRVLRDWPNADLSGMSETEEEAFKRDVLLWNSLRTAFGEAILNNRDVASVYRWANGMLTVFDDAGEQIGELQGPYTNELEERIRGRATVDTEWFGFPPDQACEWPANLRLPGD